VNLLTTSRLRLHRACPRQHWYRYELGRVPVAAESQALAFGTAIHAALEAWWRAWQTLDGIGALEAARDALPVDTDPYAAATAHALVIAYHARWARWAAGVEVLGVETAFAAPLHCPTTGRAARTWQIAGKLDGLLRLQDGRIAILEHKTTSSDARSGSDYRRRLTLDPQVGTYFEGCEALGTPAEVCIWDVLQKPAIRPLKATGEIKLRKDGQPRAGQRLSDETPEEYQARLIAALGETGPEGALAHVEVHRLAPERETHRWALWHTVREIEATREAVARTGDVRAVPQNGDACTRYGSPCPYLPVCEGTASITDDTRYRRLPVVHAELSADIQTNTLNTRKAA